MNEQATQARDYRFLAGLVLGGIVGAGLAMWLAPRAIHAVGERYRDARLRVTDAVDGLTRKGQELRDGACDAAVRAAQVVEQGAREVEHRAANAKTKVV